MDLRVVTMAKKQEPGGSSAPSCSVDDLSTCLRKARAWKGKDVTKHPLVEFLQTNNQLRQSGWIRSNSNLEIALSARERELLGVLTLFLTMVPSFQSSDRQQLLVDAFGISKTAMRKNSDAYTEAAITLLLTESIPDADAQVQLPATPPRAQPPATPPAQPVAQSTLTPHMHAANPNLKQHEVMTTPSTKESEHRSKTPQSILKRFASRTGLLSRNRKRQAMSPGPANPLLSPESQSLRQHRKYQRGRLSTNLSARFGNNEDSASNTHTETGREEEEEIVSVGETGTKIVTFKEPEEEKVSEDEMTGPKVVIASSSSSVVDPEHQNVRQPTILEEEITDNCDERQFDFLYNSSDVETFDVGTMSQPREPRWTKRPSFLNNVLTPNLSFVTRRLEANGGKPDQQLQTIAQQTLLSMSKSNIVDIVYKTTAAGNTQKDRWMRVPVPRKGKKHGDKRANQKKASARLPAFASYLDAFCGGEQEEQEFLVELWIKKKMPHKRLIDAEMETLTVEESICVREYVYILYSPLLWW